MTYHRLHHRTAAIALSVAALASCGLTACGSSSAPTTQPQRTLSPQEAAIRSAGIAEIMRCAQRHGIHLPPPTETGVNVSGVKGRRQAEAVSACYQKTVKKATREEQALKAKEGQP